MPVTSSMQDLPSYKVVVIGPANVGKSNIVTQFAHREFTPNYQTTIGIDFQVLRYTDMKLHLWDTAGEERYKLITLPYLRGSHVCVVVYRGNDQASFDNSRRMAEEAMNHHAPETCQFILVQNDFDSASDNHLDNPDNRDNHDGFLISARDFAREKKIPILRVSAKTGAGMDELENRIRCLVTQNAISKKARLDASDKQPIIVVPVPVLTLYDILSAIESAKQQMPDLRSQLEGISNFLDELSDPVKAKNITSASWNAFRTNLASLSISRDLTFLITGGVLLAAGATLLTLGIIAAVGVVLAITRMVQVFLMLAGAVSCLIGPSLIMMGRGQEPKLVSDIKSYVREFEHSPDKLTSSFESEKRGGCDFLNHSDDENNMSNRLN